MMAFIKLGIIDQIVACNFPRVKYMITYERNVKFIYQKNFPTLLL